MIMHRKQWIMLGLVALATLLVFSISQATAPQSDLAPCLQTWGELTPEEREVCATPFGGVGWAEETIAAMVNQTMVALPTGSPDARRATQEALWVAAGLPTLVPTPVPGVIPDGWEVVEPYRSPNHHLGPGLPWLSAMRSGWWAGIIIAEDGYPWRLLATSHMHRCSLIVTPLAVTKYGSEFLEEEATAWPCPEDIGWIKITDVTGPTGMITFTTETGRTGTFDLATEEWTVEGQPWGPTTTVVPQP
jgi:hypothetical protein